MHRAVDVAMRAGKGDAALDPLPPQASTRGRAFSATWRASRRSAPWCPTWTCPPRSFRLPTLIDLVAGRARGRTSARQTSFFLNVGAIGAQFEAVAAAVYNQARERGLGTEIPTDWFLQDVRD